MKQILMLELKKNVQHGFSLLPHSNYSYHTRAIINLNPQTILLAATSSLPQPFCSFLHMQQLIAIVLLPLMSKD